MFGVNIGGISWPEIMTMRLKYFGLEQTFQVKNCYPLDHCRSFQAHTK